MGEEGVVHNERAPKHSIRGSRRGCAGLQGDFRGCKVSYDLYMLHGGL
jgi:hypothetical protein